MVRFVRLESDWFARWTADDSDAAVDHFATEHKTEVDEAWKAAQPKWKAGCPLVSEIVATFGPDVAEADKTLSKDKLDKAKSLLDKGRPFGLVARELSDGPTAFTGGQLGCLTPDSYPDGGDVIAKAAAAMTLGAVSTIIETKNGYHLIRFDGLLAASDVETVGRRTVARPLAVRALGSAKAKEFGTRLISAAQGGARLDDTINKLIPEFAAATLSSGAPKRSDKEPTDGADESAALADPHAPKMEISAPFNVDGEPVPGAYGVPLGRMAFDLPKPEDVQAEPVAVAGGFVVLQLKEKTVATKEEFETSKNDVVRRLEIAKRADALTRYVARLRLAKNDKIHINEKMLEEPKAVDQD